MVVVLKKPAVKWIFCFVLELLPVFSVFDKDGDGFITMEEVIQVLTSMNIHPSEDYIKEIFHQVDLDGMRFFHQ